MRETLEALCAHAGTGSRVYSVPMGLAVAAMRLDRRGSACRRSARITALMYGRSAVLRHRARRERELGWQPRVRNVEMLCESYDWYVAHRDQILSRRGGSPHSMAGEAARARLLPHLLAFLPAAT